MKPSAFAPLQWAMNVPPILRKDGNPDDTAHHVLLVLASFANADGSNARPSITTLAEKAYKRPRVTIDALARIESAGLISKSADLNGTTVWRLHMEVSRIGPTVLDQKRDRERQLAADRQRRRRQRLTEQDVSHASAERDVTHPGCVTEPDVTHPQSVSHASAERESRIPDACVTQAAALQPLIRGGVPALDLPIDLPIDQLTPPAAAVTDDGFGAFWKAYPRKIGKGAARKAWDRVIKKTDAATITAGAARYATERAGQDPKYTPYPATWLNAERWADEPEQPQLRAVSGGYQPWTNPTDQSAYHEDLY